MASDDGQDLLRLHAKVEALETLVQALFRHAEKREDVLQYFLLHKETLASRLLNDGELRDEALNELLGAHDYFEKVLTVLSKKSSTK